MTQLSLQSNWTKFAQSVCGVSSFTKCTFYNPNNTFHIDNGKVQIDFIWADEPERGRGAHLTRQTIFRYALNEAVEITLKIYPKNTLTSLLSMFSSDKIKTGENGLDNHYIFLSNSDSLIKNITSDFMTWSKAGAVQDFVINAEIIDGKPYLTIQINDLITEVKEVNLVYNFGTSVSGKINDGYNSGDCCTTTSKEKQ
jgi:hypothetical protein